MKNDILIDSLVAWCQAGGMDEGNSESIFELFEKVSKKLQDPTEQAKLNTLIKWNCKKRDREVRILDKRLSLDSKLKFRFKGEEVEVYGETDPVQLYLDNEYSQPEIKNFIAVGALLTEIGFDFKEDNIDCHVLRVSGNEKEHEMRIDCASHSPKLEELIRLYGRNKVEDVYRRLKELNCDSLTIYWK